MSESDTPRAAIVERLVDAIHLPIGRWGRDARLVFCNAPDLAGSGRAESQLLGRTLEQLHGAPTLGRRRVAPSPPLSAASRPPTSGC